jgi:hypothetical protein
LEGGAENDSVTIDSTGSAAAAIGSLTATSISGLGITGNVNYGTTESLTIDLGSGGDTFTVNETHAGSTVVNGGGGADVINVRAISGATTINTGAGSDTLRVGSLAPAAGGNLLGIRADLTLEGGADNDSITIDSSGYALDSIGTLTATAISGIGMAGTIRYANLELLTVDLGSKADTLMISGTHGGHTQVNANSGGDSINVLGTTGSTTINTGLKDQTNLVRVGSGVSTISRAVLGGRVVQPIQGFVSVVGTAIDSLVIDDSSSIEDQSATLTTDRLTGLGMGQQGVEFVGINILDVRLGSGKQTFYVTATLATFATVIDGGSGDDQFLLTDGDLDSLAGKLTVSGGQGNDVAKLNDGGSGKRVDYRLQPTGVTSKARVGETARSFAGVSIDGTLEEVMLSGTDTSNTFAVAPSLTTRFDIDGKSPELGLVAPRLGDTLTIDLQGVSGQSLRLTPNVPGAGIWRFADGKQPIAFQGIERFNDYLVAVFSDLGTSSTSAVKVFDAASGVMKFEVAAERLYGTSSLVGVRATMGDLTGDGLSDLIVGPNKGVIDSVVRIFDGNDGRLVGELRPYADLNYASGGITVTAGDVNGDGWNDLIVAPASGGKTPIRAFSGQPGASYQKLGGDLLPGNTAFASDVNVVVADQSVNGPANRGQLFVGATVGGISTIQTFRLDVGGSWIAPAGGQFRPFGTTAKLAPRLATGDVNADGIQDLIVMRPGDTKGRMRIFDGAKIGTPIGSEFATLSSTSSANDQFVNAFDFDGNGSVDGLLTFRSKAGSTSTVSRFETQGKSISSFTANVQNFPDISGYWLNHQGAAVFVQQVGSVITITDGANKSVSGSIVSSRVTVPSYGKSVSAQLSGDLLKWSHQQPWTRVKLHGTYVTPSGELVRIQQSGRNLFILEAGGVSAAETRTSGSTVSIIAPKLTGNIKPIASSSQGILWSDGSSWNRLNIAGTYVDGDGRTNTVFETLEGGLCFVDPSGKGILGGWASSGQVRLADRNGIVGDITSTGITWSDAKVWTKKS